MEHQQNPNGSARLVAGGAGAAEVRRPPIVVEPPEDFATATRVAGFRAWARINQPASVDGLLKLHLRLAVSEAESLMWRALMRQTREQVVDVPATSSYGHGGGGRSDRLGGRLFDSEPLNLDEPFIAFAPADLERGVVGSGVDADALGVFERTRDGREERVRVPATLPDHGQLWPDWSGLGVIRRVRYEAGFDGVSDEPAFVDSDGAAADENDDGAEANPLHVGAGERALPDDLLVVLYGLAAASFVKRPSTADPERELLARRYDRRRRPSQFAVGTIGDDTLMSWA